MSLLNVENFLKKRDKHLNFFKFLLKFNLNLLKTIL